MPTRNPVIASIEWARDARRNFAITGVSGYIAPRHLRAIRNTGNETLAALDPSDSVGQLDQFSFDVRFFTETERFDRHLEKLRRGPEHGRVHYLSVCSPNYLHDAHCRMGLRVGADVICEKPLVINPWNLDALRELELETKRRVFTVLQLRVHPKLIELHRTLSLERSTVPHDVELTYVTPRGHWYDVSWKGVPERSGGIATNIGIHFFDALIWLFGSVTNFRIHLSGKRRMAGFLGLERANVRFFLSVENRDLPSPVAPGANATFRSLRIDGTEVDFSDGFDELHTRVYEEVLAGRGNGIDDARVAINLVHQLRETTESKLDDTAHPRMRGHEGA